MSKISWFPFQPSLPENNNSNLGLPLSVSTVQTCSPPCVLKQTSTPVDPHRGEDMTPLHRGKDNYSRGDKREDDPYCS